MDSGELILHGQCMLLKVFLLIDCEGSREYQKALVCSITQWVLFKEQGHPCWQMFKNNASCFNEESGEISLSILARSISAGGAKVDLEQVRTIFCLLKSKVQLASDMNIDLHGNDVGGSQGHFIDPVGSEVVVTASYFWQSLHR